VLRRRTALDAWGIHWS